MKFDLRILREAVRTINSNEIDYEEPRHLIVTKMGFISISPCNEGDELIVIYDSADQRVLYKTVKAGTVVSATDLQRVLFGVMQRGMRHEGFKSITGNCYEGMIRRVSAGIVAEKQSTK